MSDIKKDIQKIRQEAEKHASKNIKPILQAYKRALDDVRAEIAKIYMEYSEDGKLEISKQQRYTVLKQLEKQLIEQAKELGYIDLEHTTNILSDVYKDSYYKTAFLLEKGIEKSIDFSILRPEFVKAAVKMPVKGDMFSDRIWNNKEKLVSRVKRDVEQAIIEGKSPEKLARQIKNDFGVSAYESQRLIYNEVARCVTQAQSDIYEESGVVQEVMFDATLDEKTSEICQNLDGKRFQLGDEPKIPEETHVGCRSCIIPVVEGWNPTKKRENIKDNTGTKPIIEYSDYETWTKMKGID